MQPWPQPRATAAGAVALLVPRRCPRRCRWARPKTQAAEARGAHHQPPPARAVTTAGAVAPLRQVCSRCCSHAAAVPALAPAPGHPGRPLRTASGPGRQHWRSRQGSSAARRVRCCAPASWRSCQSHRCGWWNTHLPCPCLLAPHHCRRARCERGGSLLARRCH